MTSLVFVSKIGAFEGNLFTAHVLAGEEIIFFDVKTSKFFPDNTYEAPIWLASTSIPAGHILRARFFNKIIKDERITRVLSVGLHASAYASRTLDSMAFSAIMLRGDLEFSNRRAALMDKFETVVRNAQVLFFEDEFEMNKASALGSQVPHLLHRSFIQPKEKVLSTVETKKVALIHDGSESKKQDAQLSYFEEELAAMGYQGVRIDCSALYSMGDLKIRRVLAGTIRYRIGHCSRAVIFGDTRNHSTVIRQLFEQPDRVFVEDTIGNARCLDYAFISRRARGRALLDLLLSDIVGATDRPRMIGCPGPTADDLLAGFDRVAGVSLPWFYEEFRELESTSYNLFFTVAPIEDRANGARPQRIRNMAEEISSSGNTVIITANSAVLSRKRELLEWLSKNGYAARYFYGENSTTPMATYDILMSFSNLMDVLRGVGCKIGWFVRDLHWLDSAIEYDGTDWARKSLIARGITELEIVASAADRLFAPDDASIDGFNKLLEGHVSKVPSWYALPPGVSRSNVVNRFHGVKKPGTTLVYAGGTNSVYKMDVYLDALVGLDCSLNSDVYADFIVRREESDDLLRSLEKRGLTQSGRIRILHMDLDDYSPETERAIGVVLLGTDYARMSFPYKTMSMIEKGFSIVTYEDMAIAEFVLSNGVGRVSPRHADGLRAVISEMATDEYSISTFEQCRARNAWSERARGVFELLGDSVGAKPGYLTS